MIAGTLEIQMLANMARLQQDMDSAKRSVGSAMANIEKSVNQAKAALGALGLGLSVGYFANLIKGSIDAADNLKDLSKSTDLAVETLAGLRLAAKQSGGDLESIAASINKLSINIGKDAEKFRALGITAQEPMEAFKQLSDVFVKIRDPQIRAAAMAEALGKSWAGAAPLLAEGSAKIQEMVDKGTLLSGSTTAMSAAADELNDKWAELAQNGGILNRQVAPLLPLLNALADDMLELQNQSTGVTDSFNPLAEAFRAILVLGGNVAFVLKGIGTEMGGLAAQASALLRGDLKGFLEIGDLMKSDAISAREAFDAWEKKMMAVGRESKATTEAIVALSEAEKVAAAETTKCAAAFIKGEEDRKAALKERARMLEIDRKGWVEYADAVIKTYEEELAALNKLDEERNAYVEKMRAEDLKGWVAMAEAKVNEDFEMAKQLAEQQIAEAKKEQDAKAAMWKSIEDTARQTFISIFDSGKDAFTRLRDTLKNTLYALLYEMTVKKWIINIAASASGAGVAQSAFGSTGGAAGGGAGSWMSIGSSVKGVYDAVSGGFTAIGDSIAFAAEDAGAWLVQNTSGVLNKLGAQMMQSSGAIGMAASYIGAGMAGIAVGSAIAGDKELFGMSGSTTSTIGAIAGAIFGGPIGAAIGGALGGMLNAAFGEGAKQSGTTTLAGSFSTSGFSGAYRTPWSKSGGWFSSGSSGVDITSVPAAQQEAFSNMIMGTRSIFDRLIAVSGDATRSVNGWTFSINRQLATEEQQKQLIIDVANSMGSYLVPELVSLQAEGENLADTAVRMADEFAVTNRLAQLLGQNVTTAFGGIGIASLAIRDRLVQLMGGMQQMATTTQTYYQNFFTDSERHVIDLKAVSDQMATLGLAMPTTRAGFRDLVEAQDLSTVAGQNMFVALMTISSAFAAVTDSADATSKALSDLDKNRFRTLVDYQRAVAYTTAGISTVGIPGFASGGDFMGGLRIVGENGPELESTGPSRITNTNDLMSALRNPQAANAILVEEVRQMRMELAAANRQLADIKKNTLNTDRTLTKFDGDGLPPTRA